MVIPLKTAARPRRPSACIDAATRRDNANKYVFAR
jgi:hypothetical protein